MSDSEIHLAPNGRSLADFLYPTPAPRSVGGIVRWWEGRRLGYNLFMLPAGLTTVGVLGIVLNLPPGAPPGGTPMEPEFFTACLIYGVIANVCYSLGAVVESAAHLVFGRELLPVGPALWRMGLTFSLGLTLLPAMVLTFVWVVKTVLVVTGWG
jgi:hypothetical protein